MLEGGGAKLLRSAIEDGALPWLLLERFLLLLLWPSWRCMCKPGPPDMPPLYGIDDG